MGRSQGDLQREGRGREVKGRASGGAGRGGLGELGAEGRAGSYRTRNLIRNS